MYWVFWPVKRNLIRSINWIWIDPNFLERILVLKSCECNNIFHILKAKNTFFSQIGINCLRKLKKLEVLVIPEEGIPSECLVKSLCSEERPYLLQLCLKSTEFTIEQIGVLMEVAPNLKHLCFTSSCTKKLKVRNKKEIHIISVYEKYHIISKLSLGQSIIIIHNFRCV